MNQKLFIILILVSIINCTIYIRSENSGKYLDVKGASNDNLAQIIIWDYHGGSN